MDVLEHYLTFGEIRGKLAMIIPVWFPEETPRSEIVRLIGLTVADAECLIEPPHQVLVCDGQPNTKQIIEEIGQAQNRSPLVLCTEQNRGKGGAIAYGIDYLLANTDVHYLVTRDADGDHFINDVPNLVRLASQMRSELGNENIAVVGGRVDVRGPMGFARGEYELLVNDVIWHALQYALASDEKVTSMQYFAQFGLIPDFHSGFKLYTRHSAKIALAGFLKAERQMPSLDMMRHGSETVPLVEITLAGGTFGQVNRMTLETQPVVTSKGSNRVRGYANRLIWTLTRLKMPFEPAKQLLDNAIPRTLLYNDGNGRDELMQLRKQVFEKLGGTGDEPLFVHGFS